MTVIDKRNAGPKTFRFHRHRDRHNGGTGWCWYIHVGDALGSSAITDATGLIIREFPTKAAARAFAQSYAAIRGMSYREYEKPPPPPPLTEEQKAYGRIRIFDDGAAAASNAGNWAHVAELAAKASQLLAAASSTVGGAKRAHVILCAKQRSAWARRCLERWEKEIDALPTPLRLVKGPPDAL